MKILPQAVVRRGKQLQIPILGKPYKNIHGKMRHGGGGFVSVNVCWSGRGKGGRLLAEKIASILRTAG